MIVYRLEHFNDKPSPELHLQNVNAGAYSRGYNCPEINLASLACSSGDFGGIKHPTPSADYGLNWNCDERFVFVFKSLEQLHNWFDLPEGMQELDDKNIGRIGVYHIPDEYYKEGRFQSIAKDSEMNLIETRKCTFKN